MSAVFDGLEELKRKVQQAEQEANKVQGAIGQIQKDRKDRFGFSSLKRAKRVLPRLQTKERKAIALYVKVYKTWLEVNKPKLDKLLKKS